MKSEINITAEAALIDTTSAATGATQLRSNSRDARSTAGIISIDAA